MNIAELISYFRESGFGFAVSTDIGGAAVTRLPLMPKPSQAAEFWRHCKSRVVDGGEELNFNLEVIFFFHMAVMWPHASIFQLEQLVQGAVAGIHAQTGFGEKDLQALGDLVTFRLNRLHFEHLRGAMKLFLITPHMLQLREAMEVAKELGHPTYIDIHTPYATRMAPDEIERVKAMATQTVIAIETHTEPGALGNVHAQQARLQEQGLPTAKIFDIFHVLTGLEQQPEHHGKTLQQLWPIMLELMAEAGQSIIHLASGPDETDAVPILNESSLHVEQLSDEMLVAMGNVMAENSDYATIEFQRQAHRLGKPDRSDRRRGVVTLRRFLRTGVIRPPKTVRYYPSPGIPRTARTD